MKTSLQKISCVTLFKAALDILILTITRRSCVITLTIHMAAIEQQSMVGSSDVLTELARKLALFYCFKVSLKHVANNLLLPPAMKR